MMLVCWCSSLVQPAGCCLLLFPTPGWGLTYHTKYEMTRQDGSFDEILSSSTVISGLAWWWEEIRRYWWLLVNKTRYWLDLLTIILSCLLLEKNIMQILSIPQCCPCCLLFKYWHWLKESKTFSKIPDQAGLALGQKTLFREVYTVVALFCQDRLKHVLSPQTSQI